MRAHVQDPWRRYGLPVKAAVAFLFGVLASVALAQMPAAIVEHVRSAKSDLRTFDYLRAGQVVDLGRSGNLILGYLKSCLRETITGGQVTVGITESVVKDGLVLREVVECDGGRTKLTPEEARKSGTVVFRAPDSPGKTAWPRPIHVNSASPVFTFSEPVDRLVIRRLDAPDKAILLKVTGPTLDLATLGSVLALGARYEAQAGEKLQIFVIDLNASPKGGPLVGRLVRF